MSNNFTINSVEKHTIANCNIIMKIYIFIGLSKYSSQKFEHIEIHTNSTRINTSKFEIQDSLRTREKVRSKIYYSNSSSCIIIFHCYRDSASKPKMNFFETERCNSCYLLLLYRRDTTYIG